jgi:hypothetical protein
VDPKFWTVEEGAGRKEILGADPKKGSEERKGSGGKDFGVRFSNE